MLTLKKEGDVQCAFDLEQAAVSKEAVVAGSEKHLAHTITVRLTICASETTHLSDVHPHVMSSSFASK